MTFVYHCDLPLQHDTRCDFGLQQPNVYLI